MSPLFAPQRCGHNDGVDDEPNGRRHPCTNIAEAWRRGYAGKGVVVSVLDDAIESEHPDLKPNYVSAPRQDVGLGEGTLIISNLAELFVRARAQSGGRYCRQSSRAKRFEKGGIGMDIKTSDPLSRRVELVNNALCDWSDETETDSCWRPALYYTLLLAIRPVQDHLASCDVMGPDGGPSPTNHPNNASN